MDISFLVNADPRALAQHLRESAARLGNEEVTKDLLATIDKEAVPPRIFVAWLSAGGDLEAIRQGIRFQGSQTVRGASIARFGKLFRSKRVNDVWTAIGGVAGILKFLATASVCDVKSFCSQIRRSATTETSVAFRVSLVDDLYKTLRDMATSGVALETTDKRPLSSVYNSIIPACSQDVILSEIEGVKKGEPAFFAHTALFRSKFLAELQDPLIQVDLQILRSLLSISSNNHSSYQHAGLTANTQFALEALEVLSTRGKLDGIAVAILSEVATPLFRRLTRRNCSPEIMTRATVAYVTFAQKHISSRIPAKDLYNAPGASVVKSWGRRPEQLEESLTTYLRLAPGAHLFKASEWLELVKLVPGPLRLRLLGMASRCDLQTERGLAQAKLQWDSELLLALPRDEARYIFQRLLDAGAQDLNQYHVEDRRQPELDLLRIRLSQHEPNLLEMANTAVEEQQKEAGRAREQSQRAVRISYALQIAAASQHLELFRKVLLWTRRYVKDPLTAMEIFQGASFTSEESLGLLCGIPAMRPDFAALNKEQVASAVSQANIIITECFQTACQAQKEPGFQSYHWHNVLGLMSAVVTKRYERVNMLQDLLQLSDDDVFEIIWHDTLKTCMELEASGLDDNNTGLDFNALGGPLMKCNWVLPALIKPRPATLRFLDTLAKSRDGFWKHYREKHVPASVALPEPYPRGLPLECLVPVDLKDFEAGPQLPYLLSRAEKIVFVSSHDALAPQPVADDDTTAIGAFVENWQSGMVKYVYMSRNREAAALAAWEYAIGPLSATRMSELEAHVFWSKVFDDSLEDTELHGPWEKEPVQPAPPRIPPGEQDQPLEWSPGPDTKSFEVKNRRRLEPVRLDAMLTAYRTADKTIHSGPFTDAYSETKRHFLGSFWFRWRNPRTAAPSVREALIAAAMLHVSEVNSLSKGILSTPFPSGKDERFPALYLDGDFLEREDPKRNPHFVWETMKHLGRDCPATLLLRLANNLIDSPTASSDQTPPDALKLIRVLIKGERPQMALRLIQQLILDRPDDSSWQRIILTKGLLNSLPKQIAEQFLQGLSAAMQRRLAEPKSSANEGTRQKAPRIKITTVKLFSQLLSEAKFVDDAFASTILIGFLANTSHIDIRVSVLESLVDILATSKDAILCDEIIATFEAHLVPVMSGMNERAPLSREEWMACDSDNLPELYVLGRGNLPPLLACMTSSVSKVNDDVRTLLFDRVLLPTLWKSCETNGRWVNLFLKSHGTSAPTDSLPNAPTHLQFLIELMKWPAHIPATVVELWLEILAIVLQPPPYVATTNKDLMKAPNSSSGQHWLALWGPSARTILTHRTKPASMLLHEWQSSRPDGLSIDYIQKAVVQHFDLILPLYRPGEDNGWSTFIADLKPPTWATKSMGIWHQNVKPVIQEILGKVEALRTLEWQRDPHRAPAALPDTFLWRLWLLIPPLRVGTFDHEMEHFPALISDLLIELAHSRRSYVKNYETLVSFLRSNGATRDCAELALIFGCLDGEDCESFDAVHDLRIDLARRLLEAGKDARSPGEQLRKQVRSMISTWTNSVDEDVRNVGLKLLQDRDHSRVQREKTWYAQN